MKLSRLQKIRNQLQQHNLDALLVSQEENRRYLSGFTGSDGWLFISENQAYLLVDFRYVEQAKRETKGFEIQQLQGNITALLPQIASGLHCKAIGFEAMTTSFAFYSKLCESLKNMDPGYKLIPTNNLVELIRIIKEPEELELIQKASALTDAALNYARSLLRPGMKECEVAWMLEKHMREAGSEAIPFEIIVASGANAALPHARSSQQEICEGQPIVIDMGAKVNGYCSDCTRTYYLGTEDATFRRIYDTVLGAQLAALTTITAGMRGPDADKTARSLIDTAGHSNQFGHGLGHGVGLAVHELPRLSPLSNDTLDNSMVFTVEPGIYISGWGGVRIEDTVVLENGIIKTLTKTDKMALLN